MAALIPFEQELPAHLRNRPAATDNELGGGFSGGFPTISIKGKVFTLVRNGEKTLVVKPDGDGEPASNLEVVILSVAPKTGYAKTFYASGYVEGSTAQPDCQSHDGVSPDDGAPEPQAAKCALCPQNAKGSGATNQNPKAKACRSSKLLAVAPAGQLNDPMMLRVPGDSLIPLSDYGDMLAKRGVRPADVVTRIGFDYTVAHPALTFKPAGFVTPVMVEQIAEAKESDTVKAICGEKVTPKPQAEPATEVKAIPKTALAGVDDLPTEPKAAVKVEGDEEVTTKKAAPPKAKAKAAPVVVDAAEGLETALDDLDFDD